MARSPRSRKHRRVREAAAEGYAPQPQELTGVIYDSDVIIEILRGRRAIVQAARRLERSGVPTYCTPIAYAEVFAGLRSGEESLTEAFFDARGQVLIDATVGRRAGGYLARYGSSHGVELADAVVAAAASTTGLALWTLNRKHYPMADVRFYAAAES
jgi:predicted nucleic acid-binding protein